MSFTLDEYYDSSVSIDQVDFDKESPSDMLPLLTHLYSKKIDPFIRCKIIKRYMTPVQNERYEYDARKLYEMFFSSGNSRFFKEEIKYYFKSIGCDEKKINVADLCEDFPVLFSENISNNSLDMVKYLFSVIFFDQSTIRYFLSISIHSNLPLMTKYLLDYFEGNIDSLSVPEVKNTDSDKLDTLCVLMDAGFTLPKNTSDFLYSKKEKISRILERSNKRKLSPQFPVYIL
jgi:hypothetical protein